MNEFEPINKLVRRLNKIGIDVMFVGNYPWIYLDTINGIRVKEIFGANHGFHIAWYPSVKEPFVRIVNTKEMFQLIRKYIENESKRN